MPWHDPTAAIVGSCVTVLVYIPKICLLQRGSHSRFRNLTRLIESIVPNKRLGSFTGAYYIYINTNLGAGSMVLIVSVWFSTTGPHGQS